MYWKFWFCKAFGDFRKKIKKKVCFSSRHGTLWQNCLTFNLFLYSWKVEFKVLNAFIFTIDFFVVLLNVSIHFFITLSMFNLMTSLQPFYKVYCLLCVLSQYQEYKAGRGMRKDSFVTVRVINDDKIQLYSRVVFSHRWTISAFYRQRKLLHHLTTWFNRKLQLVATLAVIYPMFLVEIRAWVSYWNENKFKKWEKII